MLELVQALERPVLLLVQPQPRQVPRQAQQRELQEWQQRLARQASLLREWVLQGWAQELRAQVLLPLGWLP